MADFITTFGQRQDALVKLFTQGEVAPQRPLADIDLVGSVLIDIHHRLALLGGEQNLEERWEEVRGIAEWEWSLIEAPLRARIAEKQAAAS